MNVYEAIRQVAAAMSEQGISKDRKNAQQGYSFRGIDNVLNALSGPLCEARLTILPRVTERSVTERETKNGGMLFYVTVKVEFDFVHTEDQSKHTVVTYGEAMDSADKATNKAMSAAYKYMALLTFCIPTEASPETDADYSTHEVAGPGRSENRTFERVDKTPPAVVSEAKIVAAVAAIHAAPSMAVLRSSYNEAFVLMQHDAVALARIVDAKDDRKLALSVKAPATSTEGAAA